MTRLDWLILLALILATSVVWLAPEPRDHLTEPSKCPQVLPLSR